MLCKTKIGSVIMTCRQGSIRTYRPPRTFLFYDANRFFIFSYHQDLGPGPGTRGQGPGARAQVARGQGPPRPPRRPSLGPPQWQAALQSAGPRAKEWQGLHTHANVLPTLNRVLGAKGPTKRGRRDSESLPALSTTGPRGGGAALFSDRVPRGYV